MHEKEGTSVLKRKKIIDCKLPFQPLYSIIEHVSGVTNAVDTPFLPSVWSSKYQQYVAKVLRGKNDTLRRVFVSERRYDSDGDSGELVVGFDINGLPYGSIIEVKREEDGVGKIEVFRRDPDGWRLVAERHKAVGWRGYGWELEREGWKVKSTEEECEEALELMELAKKKKQFMGEDFYERK